MAHWVGSLQFDVMAPSTVVASTGISAAMSRIETVLGDGGYPLSVRVFDPAGPPLAQLIVLHGVVSHSE